MTLFLYRNRPSVVIGRNQNPWTECDLDGLRRAGVTLARRISGGGAVYHDPGNLNVALVAPRSMYEPARHVRLMCEALRGLGVVVEVGSRQELLVHGEKVTGSAFMLTGRRALQHGTLLVDADLTRLRACLRVRDCGIRTKATMSVPSPVANLVCASPSLTIGRIEAALLRAFRKAHGACGGVRDLSAEAAADPRYQQRVDTLSSWDWIHGRTPLFEHVLDVTVSDRPVTVKLTVRHAVVCEVSMEPADLWSDAIGEVREALCGVRYGLGEIRTALLAHAGGDRSGTTALRQVSRSILRALRAASAP